MKVVACAVVLMPAALQLDAQPAKRAKVKDFITDCEKSEFVKTPKFAETMAWFNRLAEASPMVNISSFGTSPMGRDLHFLITIHLLITKWCITG